jgi:hypothetical protein
MNVYEALGKARMRVEELKEQNDKLEFALAQERREHQAQLESILEYLNGIEEKMEEEEEKNPVAAFFARDSGIVVFMTVDKNKVKKVFAGSEGLIPYIIDSLKEQYPGIEIKEV